jgi:succinate-semialdehyde dehydrogenase / glutarate-semialdehyde dehydrogenase
MTTPLLADLALLRTRCFVNGQWAEADDEATFTVTNPATGEVIASVPAMGAEETARAVRAATEALPRWRALTANERSALLRRWFELIIASTDDLALLLTSEQGKPLAEARGEVAFGASFIQWYAEEAKRVYGDVIPAARADRRLLVLKQPVGVCAAITPWNFPVAMVCRKLAPALAAGCTMVLKPAEQTPLSALALAELASRAGIPNGVLNVVTGDASTIGSVLTSHRDVRKLSFTGSTEVGRSLMSACAATVKRLSLELGGHAPFIVFDDADLDAAARGALASKFRNAGQTCVCGNRFLVQDSVHDVFLEKFTEQVRALVVGSGLDPKVNIGPLIDEAAVEKVRAHLDDALGKGAKLLLGGHTHPAGPLFFEPTILTDANSDMLLAREETFGPIAPLFRFHTEAEALRLANDTEYGLAAYAYSRDVGRIFRVAEGLEYGVVGINTGLPSTEVAAPFGGMKQSGFGREASKYGLDEYLELKYVCLGDIEPPSA